jgi:hypothetical protein
VETLLEVDSAMRGVGAEGRCCQMTSCAISGRSLSVRQIDHCGQALPEKT